MDDRQSIWEGLTISGTNPDGDSFVPGQHLFFVENCHALSWSPDERILLIREILTGEIQENYDYVEAPYVAIDLETGDYAYYVAKDQYAIRFLSISNGRAEFVNEHDFALDGSVYQLTTEFLRELPRLIREQDIHISAEELQELIARLPVSAKTFKDYSNIAKELQRMDKEAATFLLDRIVEKFPNYIPEN